MLHINSETHPTQNSYSTEQDEGNSTTSLYVISPYSADNEGNITPDLPNECPCRGGKPCKIVFDHLRERKTGPCCSLFVMRCKTHKRGFTLYPPGYYPYSRHTLAPVDLEGNPLSVSEKETRQYSGTLFEAAQDASDGVAWAAESYENSLQMRFSTQVRHLQRAIVLFGLDPAARLFQREETAKILQIPGQLIHDCAKRILAPRCGYEAYGKAIYTILKQIPTMTLFERLAEVGAGAKLWAAPFFQDGEMLRSSLFRKVRTRGSPNKKGDHWHPQLHS